MKNISLYFGILIFVLVINTPESHAQEDMQQGIEMWRSFPSFNRPIKVATDGTTFYCATASGFYTYNRSDGMLSGYGKSNGLSDQGMSGVAYDRSSGFAILGYENSNIDLFKNGTFYNIPDLKIAQVSGDKTIYDIQAKNGLGYLSTGLGLIIINIEKREIKETIIFFDNNLSASVFNIQIVDNIIYAATSVGFFRTNIDNSFIQDYATWDKLTPQVFRKVINSGGSVYAANQDSIFKLQNDSFSFFYKNDLQVYSLDADAFNNGVWVSSRLKFNPDSSPDYGKSILINSNGEVVDNLPGNDFIQVVHLGNGEIWFLEDYGGIKKKISPTEATNHIPNGPFDYATFDVYAHNGSLWVAHGGYTITYSVTRNRSMISKFENGFWQHFPWVDDNENFQDFIRVIKDENTGTAYASSFTGGLLEITKDGAFHKYRDGFLQNRILEPEMFYLFGIALDKNGNLWMTNFGAPNELKVKTASGEWYQCREIANPLSNLHLAGDIIIDDYGQKWFSTLGSGLVVYNDNGTLENSNDDTYRVLRKGENIGNLSDNMVHCLANDKNGEIWIGTANGISIVSCPGQVIEGDCEAYLPVLQEDQFAGYFFENQAVRAIAVDGGNRKWIGTSNGVWLLSPDGRETIYRFTEGNSPLPSNVINNIDIDPITGDVYFSTGKGLVSFRSTATEGNLEHSKPLFVYPNPVPSGYGGMIAIRGLAENSDVRITDISGQLVYRTLAQGGQAVWDGKDYNGKRAQSGVYLIFGVNKDGSQKTTGKFIFHE